MTDAIPEGRPKRKVLSLKLETPASPVEQNHQPKFVHSTQSVYMVWRAGGDMPTRVYRPGERELAIGHAKKLAAETGHRFHVLRSFRAFDPEGGE
jgi:hypothetical protein